MKQPPKTGCHSVESARSTFPLLDGAEQPCRCRRDRSIFTTDLHFPVPALCVWWFLALLLPQQQPGSRLSCLPFLEWLHPRDGAILWAEVHPVQPSSCRVCG